MKYIFKRAFLVGMLTVAFTGIVGICTVKAQTSGNVTLNVVLTDVIALTVNDPTVALNFATATDYQQGLTVAKASHLTVTSNRAYDLKVKANGDLIAGAITIPVSNVKVRSTTTAGMGTVTPISLSTTDQTLAANATAAILKSVSVEYSTVANNEAFAKAAGTYTAVLVYSVVAL